AVGNEVFANR
nr:RecName: Full=Unknown protein 12 [Ginkgo biloba]